MQIPRLFGAGSVRHLAAPLCFALAAAPLAAVAQTSEVTGTVASADGVAIAGATVRLEGRGAARTARTDAMGVFTIGGVPAGTYLLRASAARYDDLSGRTIDVGRGPTNGLRLSLVRSSSSLVTIGRVQVAGGDALSTSSAPVTQIDAQEFADEGYTRISDVLQNDISTTLVHPVGGSTVLPTLVALRGPDPTETLVDIDGHQVNNGNTGDFDLSLLDPADFSSIELVKGISPSSLLGPNTIDGAINIRTLEPTTAPHGLARFTLGSFGTYGETVESTGSSGALGYAFSLHRTTSQGEVRGTILDATDGAPVPASVGSSFDGSTALAKLRYAFGRGDAFVEFSAHDQSAGRDLSAALSTRDTIVATTGGDTQDARLRFDTTPDAPQTLDGFEGTFLATHNAGYGIDASVPLGRDRNGVANTTALYRHYSSIVDESVTGPGAQTSPYLFNDRDLVGDDTLTLDHRFYNSHLTLQLEQRDETLGTDFAEGVVNDEAIIRHAQSVPFLRRLEDTGDGSDGPGVQTLALGQTQRSAVLRYGYDPSAHVHLTAAGYYSDYSIFGTSLDPRLGAVYTPDARTSVRASFGTTFQAPQLPELYVPPELPAPVGGVITIGNPTLQPDRATEYGFGFDHLFETGSHRTSLSADFYLVNLRNPATQLAPEPNPGCDPESATNPCPLSYVVNAGDARYQGFELQASRRVAPATTVTLGYAVRSSYLTAFPPNVQDGTLVLGEQSQGLPLQKGVAAIDAEPLLGLRYGVRMVYEGLSNELNRPQYATFDAHVGYRWKALELNLTGTNLSNVYDQHFTALGAGVPVGVVGGLSATDAYALQGTAITASIAHRF